MDFFLPSDGSVVIVDDKLEEAIPLIKLLSSKGIASTYYDGQDDHLPAKPQQKIRLAFFDIQLFGPSNANNYAANILRILDRLLPQNNGPYVLVLWSNQLEDNAEEIKKQVGAASNRTKPLSVIDLAKSDYFESSIDDTKLQNILSSIDEELTISFDDNDRQEFKNFISDHIEPDRQYIPRSPSAITDITSDLDKNLKEEVNIFQLFTAWERFISNAAGETVENFASLHAYNQYWSENLKNIIFQLAKAQLGENTKTISQDEILKSAIRTLNTSFLDIADNHCLALTGFTKNIQFDLKNITFTDLIEGDLYQLIWNVKTDKYQIYRNDDQKITNTPVKFPSLKSQIKNNPNKEKIEGFLKKFTDIKPSINTRLLIDTNTSNHVQPGNVYEIKVQWARKKKFLETYYQIGAQTHCKTIKIRDGVPDGKILLDNSIIEKFKFIELEVSPVCDYAQDKWIKHRFLPGIMIPLEYYGTNMSDANSIYDEIPPIQINNEKYKIIFDFKLFKSVKKNSPPASNPIFRLKNELCSSILSRLSSHASRIGIISLN